MTAVFAVFAWAPNAEAAAPANNNFAAAQTIAGTLPFSTSGTNVEATKEAGEPNTFFGLEAGKSVWYSWTAPVTDQVTLDACNAGYYAIVAVYTGSTVNTLTGQGVQRNRCRTELNAVTGTVYMIAVDGSSSAPIPPAKPEGTFSLQIRELNRPANDAFASAQTVSGALPLTQSGSNVDATEEVSEPEHAGHFPGASVWYSWTAGTSGQASIDTCSGDLDTRLGVYTGSALGSLVEVAGNDDGCFSQSKVSFNATSGTTYRIAVDGFSSAGAPAEGSFSLRIRVPGAPANDNFASPQTLPVAVPFSIADSNMDATTEGSEPVHISSTTTGASTWYSWTPTASGPVSIDTCDSDFQAALAAYTGTAIGSLTKIASNAYGCGVAARVNIAAAAGTTYRIAVAGVLSDQGTIALRIRTRPTNDDFADAQDLTAVPLPIEIAGNNFNASRQENEGQHVSGVSGGSGSLWYRWTAPSAGTFFLESCGSAVDSTVIPYTGSTVSSVAQTGTFYSNCKKSFEASAGTTYRIVVDAKLGEQGPIALTLRGPNPPANDNFANAQALSGALPLSATANTVDATRESGEPLHNGSNALSTVWYGWTPAASGPVAISDCLGSITVAVYTGSSVGGLTPVGTRSTPCNVRLAAVAGTAYRIAVVSVGSEQSAIPISIHAAAAPANDDFASAQVLAAALPVAVNGSNVDATKEAGEPQHIASSIGTSSVWYSWTPSASGSVTVEVCVVPSTFFGIDAVYTGSAVGGLTPVGTRKTRCRINLEAVAGTTYRIAVDGFTASGTSGGGGAEGTFALGIHANGPPPNDNFASAQTVSGALPLTATGTTLDSTAEAGEPKHAGFIPGATIWYSWTPASSGPVLIEGCASDSDQPNGATTAVYLGGAVNSLGEVGTRRIRCRVALTAVAGTPYKITLGTIGLIEGGVRLDIKSAPAVPANDNFESPQVLAGALPIEVAGSNAEATRQSGEPNHAGTVGSASVWYSWTPGANAEVEVDACATGVGNTLLGLYAGSSFGGLETLGKRLPVSSLERGCKATLAAVAGTTYKIAVDRSLSSSLEGPLSLRIGPPAAPGKPVLTGTSPASPANNNSPRILGTASGDTVTLYQSANCTGPVEATGTPTQLLAPGLIASVADNSSSQFSVKAANGLGTSPCSAPITYVEDSTAPPTNPGGGGTGGGGATGGGSGGGSAATPTPAPTPTPKKAKKCKAKKKGKGAKKRAAASKKKCGKKKKGR